MPPTSNLVRADRPLSGLRLRLRGEGQEARGRRLEVGGKRDEARE